MCRLGSQTIVASPGRPGRVADALRATRGPREPSRGGGGATRGERDPARWRAAYSRVGRDARALEGSASTRGHTLGNLATIDRATERATRPSSPRAHHRWGNAVHATIRRRPENGRGEYSATIRQRPENGRGRYRAKGKACHNGKRRAYGRCTDGQRRPEAQSESLLGRRLGVPTSHGVSAGKEGPRATRHLHPGTTPWCRPHALRRSPGLWRSRRRRDPTSCNDPVCHSGFVWGGQDEKATIATEGWRGQPGRWTGSSCPPGAKASNSCVAPECTVPLDHPSATNALSPSPTFRQPGWPARAIRSAISNLPPPAPCAHTSVYIYRMWSQYVGLGRNSGPWPTNPRNEVERPSSRLPHRLLARRAPTTRLRLCRRREAATGWETSP